MNGAHSEDAVVPIRKALTVLGTEEVENTLDELRGDSESR